MTLKKIIFINSILFIFLNLIFINNKIQTSNSLAQNYNQTNINICLNSSDKFELIDKQVKEPFIVKKITYNSDIYLDPDEFFYLIGITQGQKVTVNDLKNACFYLKQKNKFDQICISIKDSLNGKILHFELTALWTFEKVEFKHLSFANDKFLQLYLLEPGDPFDKKKHEHSIKKIIDKLKRYGYLDAKIGESFIYNNENKSITVRLNFNKGKLFSVDKLFFEIENNNSSDIESIKQKLEKFFTKPLKNITKLSKNKKNIQKYLIREGFPFNSIRYIKKINFEKHSLSLTIKIALKKKRCWEFQGNNHFSNEQLKEFIFSQGEPILQMPPYLLADELTQYYKNAGFWKAKVEGIEKESFYIFKINEGERTKIEKILFKGIKSYEASTIINRFFSTFLKLKYINESYLKQSLESLSAFYLKEGFWDFNITKKKFIPLKNPGKYALKIIVNEGQRYYLKSIHIENHKELESVPPFDQFTKIKQPIPFDINYLSEQSKWLSNYFQKNNQNFQIKPEFIYDNLKNASNKYISVVWKISLDKNAQTNFGKTVIRGNSNFPFKKIERELEYKENSPWEKEKLGKTFLNLNDLNTFESIHLYPDSNNDINGNKPVILKLYPDKPIELRTRFGFAQSSNNLTPIFGKATYKIGGSLLYKNPYALGHQFKLDIDFSRFERNLTAEYKIPWIFQIPIKTIAQAFYSKYNEPLYTFYDEKKTLYEITKIGGLLGFSKKYSNVINGGINFGFETDKITHLNMESARAINFSFNLIDKYLPYFFVEPNIVIDLLDDKLNPKSGSLTAISLKGMFKENNSLFRVLIEQSFFSYILKPIIIAVRFRFGHVFCNNFNKLLPSERFYLGGPNSLRSYEPDLAPPLGCFINNKGEKQYVPQGGKTMFNANFELRIPLFQDLSLALFEDLGYLSQGKEKNKSKLLTATGLGLRYNTPIGPIRFDVGWRPKKENGSSFAWVLTLGHAF